MNTKESKQKEKFSSSEGDEWFNRNIESSTESDKIVQLFKSIELFPKRVLEIGCSNGNSLNLMKDIFGSEC